MYFSDTQLQLKQELIRIGMLLAILIVMGAIIQLTNPDSSSVSSEERQLSAEEREEIERQFYEEDPDLARAVKRIERPSRIEEREEIKRQFEQKRADPNESDKARIRETAQEKANSTEPSEEEKRSIRNAFDQKQNN